MRCTRLFVAWLVAVAFALAPLAASEPKKLLLVGQSADSHPPSTHEYMAGVERLAALVEPTPGLEVRVVKADDPWSEGPALLDQVDGVVLFVSEGALWATADPRRHEALARLAARGGGMVVLHWGMGTRAAEPIQPFLKLFGGCHGGPDRKYKVVDAELRFVAADHPITRGLDNLAVHEEFYYKLKFAGPPESMTPVAQVTIDGEPQTVAWAYERPDGGRSFGFSGLHFDDNWRHEAYRKLLAQATLWTLGLSGEPGAGM